MRARASRRSRSHARTAEQLYSGRADWTAIGRLKEAVTTVPVLGNGDIWEAADALAMVAATGCDGVVVGRGCLGRPWLFADLEAAFAGKQPPPPPRLGEVATVMADHARLLVDWAGEGAALRDFRKHTGWYLTGYPCGPEVRRRLAMVETLAELDDLLAGLDPDLELVPGGSAHPPRATPTVPARCTCPTAGWTTPTTRRPCPRRPTRWCRADERPAGANGPSGRERESMSDQRERMARAAGSGNR